LKKNAKKIFDTFCEYVAEESIQMVDNSGIYFGKKRSVWYPLAVETIYFSH